MARDYEKTLVTRLLPARKIPPVPMLVLLTVIWGMTFPATKAALEHTAPMQFLAMRFLIALAILTPFVVGRQAWTLDLWRRGLLVGVLMFAGFALQVWGMRFTTASRSGFFTGLLVLITPMVAQAFRTSLIPRVTWFAIPMAVAGIYLLADPRVGGMNVGDWLTIGCAFAFAFQMVSLEHISKARDDVWGLTYVQIAVLSVGASIWSVAEGAAFRVTPTGWLAAGYTGLFGGVGAIWLQTRFQPETSAGHAAIIFSLEPVFAALFAWLLLGDLWTERGLAGAVLILGSMVYASLTITTRQDSSKSIEHHKDSTTNTEDDTNGFAGV